MENASKALLIAGSVLIAIVLIAVGIKILNSTSGVTEQVGKVSTTMEASIFNSQFEQYEGKRKGNEVKSLLRLVKQNNISLTKSPISVELYETSIETGRDSLYESPFTESDYNNLYQAIYINYTYDIIMEIDSTNGYINKILIVQENN